MNSVSDSIARWLHDKEITHAFGIVGGGNVALWNAIKNLEKTSLVAVHHEQAAAMAATYYFRTAKKPALCLVTTGAGSANALTGVLAAYFDSIPLIVVSGNEASHFLAESQRVKGTQGFVSASSMKPFVKLSVQMNKGDEPWNMMDWAYRTAMKARQGPVWVDVPKDVQTYDQPQ